MDESNLISNYKVQVPQVHNRLEPLCAPAPACLCSDRLKSSPGILIARSDNLSNKESLVRLQTEIASKCLKYRDDLK